MDETSVEGPGSWIVLEGIDGAGKSSTARAAVAGLANLGASYCSHKEISDETPLIARTMQEVASILWPRSDATFVRSLPSRYRVHVHAAWYSLFVEFVLKRRVARGDILLLDSWYYKFIAHLVVYGYDIDDLGVIFDHVPAPDLVVMLDPDPEVVWERNRDFGPIELGLYMDYPNLGRDSFVDYQSRIRTVLREMARRSGWDVVPIDPNDSLADAAQEVERRVRCLRKHQVQVAT